jgi:malate synthase
MRAEIRAGELLAEMAARKERHAGKAAKGSRVATPTDAPKLVLKKVVTGTGHQNFQMACADTFPISIAPTGCCLFLYQSAINSQ